MSILLGIGYNSSTKQNFLESINPATGSVTVLKSFVFDTGSWFPGTLVANGTDAFAVSSDGRLYDFNATTGAIKSTVSIGNVQELAPEGNSLLGIGYNSSTKQNFLESINPATGSVTVLKSFVFDTGSWFPGTFVANGTDAFAVSSDGRLYDFNATTGAIKSTVSIGNVQELAPEGNSLLGIGYNSSTKQNFLESINPATGSVTVLKSFVFDTGSWFPDTFVANGTDAFAVSSDGRLYDFNATTGAIKSTASIGNVQSLTVPSYNGLDTVSINAITENASSVAHGYSFVCAYLNPHAVGSDYQELTSALASNLIASGIQIVSIFQTASMARASYYESDALKKGIAVGKTAYLDALRDGQGAYQGAAIYFGVDLNPALSNNSVDGALLADIATFFSGIYQGFKAAAGGIPKFTIGVYGAGATDGDIIGRGLGEYSWLANATSWIGTTGYSGWNIEQLKTTSQFGVSIDPDKAFASPFGQWGGAPKGAAANVAASNTPAVADRSARHYVRSDGARPESGASFTFVDLTPAGGAMLAHLRGTAPTGHDNRLAERQDGTSLSDIVDVRGAPGSCTAPVVREMADIHPWQ